MITIDKETFIDTCNKSLSMCEACTKLGLHFNTFKHYAIKFNCYVPNQSGKGKHKKNNVNEYKLEDILASKYPQYQAFKLKNKLIKAGLKENKCECCGISEWNGKQLNMELHHIDGNKHNHSFDNLLILCPNCHAQTDNYRAKNIR